MKFISLFAGIGGLDLGLERAGMECVAQVEINEFCQKVLQKHWANVPKFKDVRDVGKHNLPPADLICGGFPCQDVSLAGERAGLEGKRSTLWSEFYRIVCEIRPRWIVIENVPGLLSSDNGEFFTKILRELSQSGYDVEWQVIPAAFFGAPHIRERVFIVGYPSGGKWEVPNIPQVFRVENFGKRNKTKRSEGGNVPSMGWENNSGLEREWNDWSNQPTIKRVVDGLPFGMDRLGALGNAVVPQAAEFVGLCIRKAETRLTPLALDGAIAPDNQQVLPADVLVGEGTLPEPPRQ